MSITNTRVTHVLLKGCSQVTRELLESCTWVNHELLESCLWVTSVQLMSTSYLGWAVPHDVSSVVLMCSVCYALAIFWYQILLLSICSCIHFQVSLLGCTFLMPKVFCMRYHRFCKDLALLYVQNYWLTYCYPSRSWSEDTTLVTALSSTDYATCIKLLI